MAQKVREAIKDDILSIDATNDNFGEPAPNMAKELKVVVKYKGKDLTFTVKEGEPLIIDQTILDAELTKAK